MANTNKTARALIEGRAALIVIDIQASTFVDDSEVRSIDNMPGYKDRMLVARTAIDAARAAEVPVIFIDTGHLFAETYQYAQTLQERLGVNLKIYQPQVSAARMQALWEN